ncbi:dsDNA nuclease domain-containing protein [Streptomyces sp. NPDC058335]|uniref:dsDNA nuclease domain-containing protein n=1 Tax=Streptomyces sp. NPDC058335 TaxID=3346451 RepID=UPI0036653E28
MADPIETVAPDDSGSVTLRRYEYQVHVAAQAVLEMLADEPVRHVTCEHIEDIIVARNDDQATTSGLFWDFQQIKTRDTPVPWTLADVLAKGPLKSLWRTYGAVKDQGLAYQLTAGLEGYLDPADALVTALARGMGADQERCLKRVATHLKADPKDVSVFMGLVRVRELPRREDVELRNTRFLHELGPSLTGAEITGLYDELVRRTREAMQGRLGPRWVEQLAVQELPAKLLRKRIGPGTVADLRQRLLRPDHVLLTDVSRRLHGVETALVRKLRRGAATNDVIEDAQMFRAHAEHHRLTQQSLGTWPAAPAVEADLDERLLLVARRTIRGRADHPRPANAVFDDLQTTLETNAATHDRWPLYARDGVLLMGRACAISDECRFDWGTAHESPA